MAHSSASARALARAVARAAGAARAAGEARAASGGRARARRMCTGTEPSRSLKKLSTLLGSIIKSQGVTPCKKLSTRPGSIIRSHEPSRSLKLSTLSRVHNIDDLHRVHNNDVKTTLENPSVRENPHQQKQRLPARDQIGNQPHPSSSACALSPEVLEGAVERAEGGRGGPSGLACRKALLPGPPLKTTPRACTVLLLAGLSRHELHVHVHAHVQRRLG